MPRRYAQAHDMERRRVLLHLSQDAHLGSVSATMSSWGHDMSVIIVWLPLNKTMAHKLRCLACYNGPYPKHASNQAQSLFQLFGPIAARYPQAPHGLPCSADLH